MKKIIYILIACIFLIGTLGCKNETVLASEMADEKTRKEVMSTLKTHGLSNVDTYEEWVEDFVKVSGKEANLSENWVALEALNTDVFTCMDNWEATYDYSDTNCRMTAFLLLEDVLQFDQTMDQYDGTFLMFDQDAIETVDKYAILKEKEKEFLTLFHEVLITNGETVEVYPNLWKDYGIHLDSDTVSLITVVIEDKDNAMVYVGHTGVLIDCGDDQLFVEKIAFEQPYQVTKIKKIDDLVKMFEKRPEYFTDDAQSETFVYRNDACIQKISLAK